MRANAMRFVLTLGVALVLGAVLAGPASAQDGTDELTDRDQIVMNGRLLVPEGDTVDTAVLFHGSATIEGTVTESVVVFDGQTEISGHVQQDVFVFNGDVTVTSGAQIDGDLVTGQTPTVEPGATVGGQQQRISTRFDADAVGVASRFAWWLGYSVSTLVLGLLLLLIAPGLDAAIVRSVRERMGASIGFGALGLLPAADRRDPPARDRGCAPAGLVHAPGARAPLHRRVRRRGSRDRSAAGEGANYLAVPRLPRRMGDPPRAWLDPGPGWTRVDARIDLRSRRAVGGDPSGAG